MINNNYSRPIDYMPSTITQTVTHSLSTNTPESSVAKNLTGIKQSAIQLRGGHRRNDSADYGKGNNIFLKNKLNSKDSVITLISGATKGLAKIPE